MLRAGRAVRARARAPAVGGRGQPPTAHRGRGSARRSILPAVPEPLSIAQVTPYPWEDRHDVNTFVARVSDELAAARAPRARGGPVVVAHARARLAQGGAQRARSSPAPGEVRVLAVGEALPPLPGPPPRRAADRRRAHDLRPLRARRARPLPRPRAVRAQRGQHRAAPLARAQRRHLPRADRARRRHAGRAQGRAARLRAPRRAHRDLSGRPPTCCAASSRASTRSSRPAPTRSRAASATTTRPCASPSSSRRSAAPCGSSCARCAASIPALRWEAVVHSERGPSSSTPLRADLLERVRFVDDADDGARAAPTCSSRPPTASPRRPGCIARAQAAGAVPRRLAPGRLRGGAGRRRGRAALRAQRPRDAHRAARAAGRRRRPARAPARGGAAAAVERGGRRARGPLRARSRRAATTSAATPRSPAGCRAGARSTSTCTCTPTTATTAPRPSRCCWPPRAPRASARSR